jgi:hypothetical protein
MFGLVLPLLVVAGIVWFVRSRGRPGSDSEHVVVSLRRTLQHAGMVATLAAGAVGVARLLEYALTPDLTGSDRASHLALGLALSLVAGPVWFLLWRVVTRTLREDPSERAAPTWGLHLVVVTTGALIVAVVNLIRVGDAVLDVQPYEPAALALLLVAVPVWVGHVLLGRHPELAPTSSATRLLTLAGSLVGLVTLAVGAGGVLRGGLVELYWAAFGPPIVDPGTEVLRHGLVLVVVGAAVWWWYWLREEVDGPRDALGSAYLLLVGVLGGLVTAVVAAGFALGNALEWLIAEPFSDRAAVHFADQPIAIAAGLVGLTVWWYHRRVLEVGAARTDPEVTRVYEHLAAGVGLVAAIVGVTQVVVALIELAVPATMLEPGVGPRQTLVVALPMLVVGVPVWAIFWHRIQDRVRRDPQAEARTLSRRVYLSLLFGLAGVVALVSSVAVLFVTFRDLIAGDLGAETLYDLRIAAGLVVAAGATAAYHATVHRRDRAVLAPCPTVAVHPRDVLLIGPDGRDLAVAVAADVGAKVRSLHRLDARPVDVDPHEVADAIRAAHHEHVLVTIGEDGTVEVIPFERV